MPRRKCEVKGRVCEVREGGREGGERVVMEGEREASGSSNF